MCIYIYIYIYIRLLVCGHSSEYVAYAMHCTLLGPDATAGTQMLLTPLVLLMQSLLSWQHCRSTLCFSLASVHKIKKQIGQDSNDCIRSTVSYSQAKQMHKSCNQNCEVVLYIMLRMYIHTYIHTYIQYIHTYIHTYILQKHQPWTAILMKHAEA